MISKYILITGAFFGFTAVILGAFGAHALKDSLSAENIKTFETGVKYQIYHALLLLFIGSTNILATNTKSWLFYFIVVGIILFSGSIYGLATNALTSFDFKKVGFITPIGGLLLIVSWIILFVNFLKMKV